MRYFFRVEYDGSKYGGWQSQPNAISIQELIESAFSVVVRSTVKVTGAGRTDAGVHARGQGAHVDLDLLVNPKRCEMSVNAVLPHDVAIYNLKPVEESFHARFSAINRCYKYYFCTRKQPLNVKRVWMLYYDVDWSKIKDNLEYLKGKHDFSAFCASGSTTDNTVCTVKNVVLENDNENYIFTIEADRFIYKMVRTIVGTLIDIGRGKFEVTLEDIIKKKDRRLAGVTAPPFGLVLEKVDYPGGIE